jgi:hypothetical protein
VAKSLGVHKRTNIRKHGIGQNWWTCLPIGTNDATKWAHECELVSMHMWIRMNISKIFWWWGQNIFRISYAT